jgi:hypothetical protein
MTPPDLIDSRLDIAGRVATLTLNRDDVRNELTGTLLAGEIVAVVDWINAAKPAHGLRLARRLLRAGQGAAPLPEHPDLCALMQGLAHNTATPPRRSPPSSTAGRRPSRDVSVPCGNLIPLGADAPTA